MSSKAAGDGTISVYSGYSIASATHHPGPNALVGWSPFHWDCSLRWPVAWPSRSLRVLRELCDQKLFTAKIAKKSHQDRRAVAPSRSRLLT